jgi:hypothetical protein
MKNWRIARDWLLVPALVIAAVVLMIVYVPELLWRIWDVPGVEHNYREVSERVARYEEEQEQKRKAAERLAVQIARDRGIEQSLEDATDRSRKLEALKVHYEAALLVRAPNSLGIRHAALDLASDAVEDLSISSSLDEISDRVDKIRKEFARLQREKDSNGRNGQGAGRREYDELDRISARMQAATTEEELASLREEFFAKLREIGPPENRAKAPPPAEIGFETALGGLIGAATDEERLVWAEMLKGMNKLSEAEVGLLCEYYDTLADTKQRYIALGILTNLLERSFDPVAAGAARSKLITLLSSSDEWPMKVMIGYALARHGREGLESEEKAALLQAFDREENPLAREQLLKALGNLAASDYADLFLEISKSEKSPKVRAAAIGHLDAHKPEHKKYLLTAIQSDASDEVRKEAWKAIASALQLEGFGDGQDFDPEKIAALIQESELDPEIYAVFVQAIRGNYGSGSTRRWLLREYILFVPKLWSPKMRIDEVLKQLADSDPDEDIRSAASDALKEVMRVTSSSLFGE